MRKIINTNIGIVIICLFCAVCVMADFIVIDNALDSFIVNNEVKNHNEGNHVIEDTNSSNDDISEETLKNIIEEQLFGIFSKQFQPVVKKEDIDNESKLLVALKILEDEYTYTQTSPYTRPDILTIITEFSESKLEEAFNSSVIGDLGIYHEDFGLYNFDDSSSKYIRTGPLWSYINIGHMYILPVASIVKSYEKKFNQYVISMNYLFSDAELIINSKYYYGSITDLKNGINPIVKSCEFVTENEGMTPPNCLDAQEYLDNNYNDIKDSLPTYTYVFEKQNGKIILTDFSIN